MCRLKTCSVVLLPALKPACSSAIIFSACGFNLFSTEQIEGEEEELAILVDNLDKASTAYGIKISAKKTKLMTTPVASTRRSK